MSLQSAMYRPDQPIYTSGTVSPRFSSGTPMANVISPRSSPSVPMGYPTTTLTGTYLDPTASLGGNSRTVSPSTIRAQRMVSAPTTSLGGNMLGTGSFRTGSPLGSVGLGTTIYEPQAQILTLESLQLQIRQMHVALTEERQQRLMLQGQLLSCQRRLDKLDPPDTPLRAAVRMVENRGNIRVSHATGQVSLLRRLDFQPRTTKEEPSAVFRDPDVAEAICKDLAEISSIFNCPMTIEGHTKGGESEFWQTLANRRARIVAELMIDFGAEPSLLHTCGLPGRHGKNAVDTEVHMDIKNIKDELIPLPETTEVDVIVNGRVVERDFIQAGRVVKRDTIAAPVLERDVVDSSGRVIERDFFVRPPETDSIGFSGSGRAVERQITPTQTIFSSERQITPTRRPLTPRTVVLRPSIMS